MNKKAIMGMLYTAGGIAVGFLIAKQIEQRVPFFNASGDFMMASGSASRTAYRKNFK